MKINQLLNQRETQQDKALERLRNMDVSKLSDSELESFRKGDHPLLLTAYPFLKYQKEIRDFGQLTDQQIQHMKAGKETHVPTKPNPLCNEAN